MAGLEVVKSADRSYVFMGMSCKVKFFILVTNTDTTVASCVKIKDFLGAGLKFIGGSVSINGYKQNVINLESGITVGIIPPGGNAMMVFDAYVERDTVLKEVINQATVTYCDENGQIHEIQSDILRLPVYKINVCIQKVVDKQQALIGEVLSYSIIIRNESNVKIDQVILYDELSSSLQLLPGSVLMNLTPQYIEDFSKGFLIGTLQPFASIMISFQAQVMSYPACGLIENKGRVTYEYTVQDHQIPVTSIGEACSYEVVTKIINEVLTC